MAKIVERKRRVVVSSQMKKRERYRYDETCVHTPSQEDGFAQKSDATAFIMSLLRTIEVDINCLDIAKQSGACFLVKFDWHIAAGLI
jgi:hypothetical protein